MKTKFLIILALVLTITITACGNGSNGLGEAPVEESEDVKEGAEDVGKDESEPKGSDASNGEGDQVSDKWPTDFMPEVPKLHGEIILAKKEGPNKYLLEFKGIEHDRANEYVEALKDKGFNKELSEESNESLLKYKAMDDNKNLVVFIWKEDTVTKLELVKKDV